MKITFPRFALSALALGLGLSFTTLTSCKDNDLSEGGSNHGSGSEQIDEKAAQKYNTLECLLSALGNVDTLPDNWNSADYRVDPTIGVAESEAAPYSVRLVATTNVDEANREFRSMISAPMGGTAKDTTWTQEGVGTLSFKVAQNDPSLYATLTCNLQQVPKLQEIRFVPATVIGDNAGGDDVAYYQFGDIIKQTIGDKVTYWVCVRPASKKSKDLGRSHWCTFQLVPKGADGSNYKQINDNNYLPTGLCANRSDGVRMTQNFFNVLRIMSDPNTLSRSKNLDKIVVRDEEKPENVEFSRDDAERISYMWNFENFWDKIFNTNFNSGAFDKAANSYVDFDLKDYLAEKGAMVNAFFYGYSSILFGEGNYRVYNMNLKAQNEDGLFTSAKETTPWLLKSNAHDFSAFERDGNSKEFKLEGDLGHNFDHQFIVKHHTGAQFDNSWLKNDKNMYKSFTLRPANGIKDVFVSREWVKTTAEEKQHGFFVPGDQVKDVIGSTQFCIKNSIDNYVGLTKNEKVRAYFLYKDNWSADNTHYNDYIADKLSDKLAQIILFQLYRSYRYAHDVSYINFKPNNFLDDRKDVGKREVYKKLFQLLNDNFYKQFTIQQEGNHDLFKVNLRTKNETTCYTLDYDKINNKCTISKEDAEQGALTITVTSYLDSKAYVEEYTEIGIEDKTETPVSTRRTLISKGGNVRNDLSGILPLYTIQYLE